MIQLSKSIVGPLELEAVRRVFENGYIGMGTECQHFESELAAYIGEGVKVVCVNTGTSALHLAVQALGIGHGDEVLVPSLTYLASFQAVSATGATPIPCDVHLSDGLINLQDAEKRITSRTKAIMPVHYASKPCNYDALLSFSKKYSLRMIEDAAHSFGCTYHGHKIGALGDIVCFSFDPIKNITSGEGGAIVSRDPLILQKVQDARLLGVEKDSDKRYAGQRSWEFDVKEQGWRYHMSNLMAAIGRTQLSRFDGELKPKRIRIGMRYREELAGMSGVQLLESCSEEDTTIVPHILPIRILDQKRERVRAALLEKGVQVGQHYKPNHLLTKFAQPALPPLPVAEQLYDELLTLPLHPDVRDQDVDHIISVLKEVLSS